jgi:hypothetical protein
VHPVAERQTKPGDVVDGRDLAGIDPQRGFPRDTDQGRGHRPVPGLPVHLVEPRVGEVSAVQARADQGRDHPPDPVPLARRGRGVDDRLRVPGRDVLAGDRADDRGGEPLAQPPLGIGVLARPPLFSRLPVRVEVRGDQVRARPPHVRRVGRQPLGDLLQLAGQPVFAHRLALLPFAVLVPDRTPPVSGPPGRVDRDPVLQLDDQAARGRAGRRGRGQPASRLRAARTVPVIRRGTAAGSSAGLIVARRVLRCAPSRWRAPA